MDLDIEIFADPRENELQLLRQVSREDLLRGLTRYLESWLPATWTDDEELSVAGRAVIGTGHLDVDADLFRWVGQDVSDRRRDVMAGFLEGYWERTPSAFLPAVQLLRDAARKLPPESDSFRLALSGLFSVTWNAMALPPRDRQELIEQLLSHLWQLEERGLHRGLADQLLVLRKLRKA